MLLTANLPIILWVQMVLLIDKVVQPPIKVAAVLLLIPIIRIRIGVVAVLHVCLLYTSPSPRDLSTSRMPSSA